MLLARLLGALVQYGDLTVIDAHGRPHRFAGRPITDIPPPYRPGAATIRLHDKALHWKLALRPTLYAGEAYMDGTLTVEDGSLYDFLGTILYNVDKTPRLGTFGVEDWANRALRWLHQHNPLGKAEENVAHHYDLSADLYRLFLDEDQQYSCAYFQTGTETLEDAQRAKKRHIAAKLDLRPGQRVLDIGCGWGGMALTLARDHDVHVQGITLSREQLAVARRRAKEDNLSGQVEFALRDYRFEEHRYDRIVSVGMFEHVGVNHYAEFFGRVRDLLTEDGVCLLHSIGRVGPPGGTNAWIRKYIFPGGYTPALSEVAAIIERSGLMITDVEVLRNHYALTLRAWNDRFQAQRQTIARLYDERFCRMWEFYLIGCEVAFRCADQVVFQIQIARNRHALPETRTYMYQPTANAETAAARPACGGDRAAAAWETAAAPHRLMPSARSAAGPSRQGERAAMRKE
jgi:cyclopropane-fatty-acyl-phospholipid synthase